MTREWRMIAGDGDERTKAMDVPGGVLVSHTERVLANYGGESTWDTWGTFIPGTTVDRILGHRTLIDVQLSARISTPSGRMQIDADTGTVTFDRQMSVEQQRDEAVALAAEAIRMLRKGGQR